MTHEPFFSYLACIHDQTCNCMSPMNMHDLKARTQVTRLHMATKLPRNNSKHTQQEKYMQKAILPRLSNCQTQDVTPTNMGPPSSNSTTLVLQDEVPLAKTKSHLPKIKEEVRLIIENLVLTILKYNK